MPDISTVNNLIEKLLSQPLKSVPLVFNGSNVERKYLEIQNFISSIDIQYIEETSLRALAGFLQYTPLSLFNEEELLILLYLDYAYIENTTVVSREERFNIHQPIYDIGTTILNDPEFDDLKSSGSQSYNDINSEEVLRNPKRFQFLRSLNSQLSLEYLAQILSSQL